MTRECIEPLIRAGITYEDAMALRRIAMTLHGWHELECGTDHGAIERDETTGKAFWRNAMTGKRYPCADRETGAKKRLAKIMARYPVLQAYIQGDPRGAALYILRAGGSKCTKCGTVYKPPGQTTCPTCVVSCEQLQGDVPEGAEVDSYYSRGLAVYK